MEDTVFAKIIRREIPANIVYEDNETLAFLDNRPNAPGHTLVIPKNPYVSVFDIDDATFSAVMSTVRKLAPRIRDAVGAQGVNINSNHGAAAGQLVFHLHIHIIPRFDGDGLEFTWPKKDFNEDEMRSVADAIRKLLPN